MKSECTQEQLKTTLPLLYTYIRNIHENSAQEKYRKIRTGLHNIYFLSYNVFLDLLRLI